MRSLIEINLAKEFGWTVKEINETPYKWIQKYYFLDQIMTNASEIKNKTKASANNTNSPFPKNFRNVIPGVTPGVPGKSDNSVKTAAKTTSPVQNTKNKEKK